MLFKLKHVKINFPLFPGVNRSENILRIMKDGSRWETFDPISAINEWSIDRVRHAIKEKGPRSCKSRNSAKVNVKYIWKMKNISENGEEGYLVSSDSE